MKKVVLTLVALLVIGVIVYGGIVLGNKLLNNDGNTAGNNLHGNTDNEGNNNRTYPKDAVTTKAKVIKIAENYILADLEGSGLVAVSTRELNANNSDIEKITEGDEIRVISNGMIAESYPGQLGNVYGLEFVKDKYDVVGLYKDLIIERAKNNSGLIAGIETVGIDFTNSPGLTDRDKQSIIYLVSNEIPEIVGAENLKLIPECYEDETAGAEDSTLRKIYIDVIQTTMEELKKTHGITENGMFWGLENAVMITLKVDDDKIKDVKYDKKDDKGIEKCEINISLYKGGDGAVGNEYEVEIKDGKYTFEVEKEWIS